MADEYISKQAVLNLPQSIERNLCGEIVERSIDVKDVEALKPADVMPICQTGCKGCKRENNLVVGSCSLYARFYEDMYEGIE